MLTQTHIWATAILYLESIESAFVNNDFAIGSAQYLEMEEK